MSFGFSVGDVVGVSTLAWKVFKSCKDSSENFKNLSGEVVSLHVVLKETEDLIVENGLSQNQAAQLKHVADGCQKVLGDLEEMLTKYRSLGTKSQRTWDRMKWGNEGIADLRARLTSNTSMLSACNSVMMNSSMARVEQKLNQFMDEVRSGKRESSVASKGTEWLDSDGEEGDDNEDDAGTDKDDTCWLQLRRELEDVGVSSDKLFQHKQFIISWYRKALAQEDDEGSPVSSELPGSCHSPEELETVDQDQTTVAVDSNDSALRGPTVLDSSPAQKKQITVPNDALNFAAMHGQLDVVRYLIEQPGIRINNKNHLGHTPLSLACWYGYFEVVQLLLDKAATEIDPTDWEAGQTPLSLAIEQGNTSIVQLLLAKGADPNSRDKNGRTPLGWAALKERSEETKLLLTASQILPNLADKDKITPLHQAVESRSGIIVKLLMSRQDIDLHSRDCRGRTALDLAKRKRPSGLVYLFDQALAKKQRSVD